MLKNRIANPYVRSLVEWLLAIALAFVLFLILRNFVFRLAHVSGSSMEPTLMHNDMVILSRLSYLISDPKTGDIIAFPFKENPSEFYIKRVIGVTGDIIDLQPYHFLVIGIRLDDDFSQALRIIRIMLLETSGFNAVISGSGSLICLSATATTVCPSKGSFPVTISYIHMPRE
jgi:signal peptidase I